MVDTELVVRQSDSAGQVWSRLEGIKRPLLTRVERYAAMTIPKVCLPDGFNPESTDQTHDYQSLGAQAVNHVVNKLAIAMFAPSKPFFRVAAGKETQAKASVAGMSATSIDTILAAMEREGSKMLDELGQRPKLYQALRHLVIAGNVLMVLDKGNIRIHGLRYFCVKRTAEGKIHTLVTREQLRFDELDPKIQLLYPTTYQPETKVSHYRMICRTPQGGYTMCQYIDEQRLPASFDGRWTEEKMPYCVLTWDLADESDYATSLVEEYAGDLESVSVLAEAIVTGGVIGTEFRWVANPNGMTSIDDMQNSRNGDTIPGNAKDITAITPPVTAGVEIAMKVSSVYEQRISRGFLLTSAVTRNAERVTAEEIRTTFLELEGAFGGTYSALAPSLQRPIALWMLANAETPIGGTDLNVIVITGLDALSRNGDLDNLRQAIGTLSSFAQAPEALIQRIKWDDLAEFVGQGTGVDLKRFIMSSTEFAQVQQQMAAQQQAQEVATAGGVASAEAEAQPPQQ